MISDLRVQNFRSHRDFSLTLASGMNIITGANGSGKTSLLEAIYIALVGKSWRSNFEEIIRRPVEDNSGWWRLDATIDKGQRTIKYQHKTKQFVIDDRSYGRFPSSKRLPVVLFEPNDMQLLYGSPARRREFFDRAIAVIYPEHQAEVSKFERVLRQRNNLLKQEFVRPEELMIWDIQFCELSTLISNRRRSFIKKVNETLNAKYAEISGRDDQVKLNFVAGAPLTPAELRAVLASSAGPITPAGAQKDDFKFIFNHKDSKTSASRGENRTILFALLAVIVDVVRANMGRAYVLLDDIDSELDLTHRLNLYATSSFQEDTIATTLSYDGDRYNHVQLS